MPFDELEMLHPDIAEQYLEAEAEAAFLGQQEENEIEAKVCFPPGICIEAKGRNPWAVGGIVVLGGLGLWAGYKGLKTLFN